jgi:Leucine-rich repeat (LRR) protein
VPSRICRINLSHNQLTECNSLSHLSKLKHLFVDNNKISDISFEVCACSSLAGMPISSSPTTVDCLRMSELRAW